MTKPNDTPRDVWDKAVAAYEEMPLVYDGWNEDAVVECIAALMLATEMRNRKLANNTNKD